MYAITGITGNVGGSVANSLLAAGRPVRAVMRNVGKGDVWAERGCEVVQADIADTPSLASAFKGAEGVFVLVPPNFDPAPGFPEARATAASLRQYAPPVSAPVKHTESKATSKKYRFDIG
jgi:NAD(P)H dehydrogenase (quinone)